MQSDDAKTRLASGRKGRLQGPFAWKHTLWILIEQTAHVCCAQTGFRTAVERVYNASDIKQWIEAGHVEQVMIYVHK